MSRGPAVAILLILTLGAPLSAAQRTKIVLRKSLSELEALAQSDSNDAAAHYALGLGYWSKKRWDDAERALRRAIAVEPKYAQAYLALAVLPDARGDKFWDRLEKEDPETARKLAEEARSFARRAFLIDPLVDLGIVGTTVRKRSPEQQYLYRWSNLYFHYQRGLGDIRKGDYEKAYGRFREWVRYFGSEDTPGLILMYHGLSAAHIGHYDDAIDDFEILFDRASAGEDSDSLVFTLSLEANEYRYVLAFLHHRAGDVDSAVDLYRRAIEQDLGLYVAHVRLSEIHEAQRRWKEAIQERRNAIHANPEDPSLLFDLGITLTQAGWLEEAEQAFLDAVAANPRDTRALYLLGVVQSDLGKADEARKSLLRFLELAPRRFERIKEDAFQRVKQLADAGALPDGP